MDLTPQDNQYFVQKFFVLLLKDMPEKLANSATAGLTFGLTRRVGILICVAFLATALFWRVDQSTANNVLDFWRYPYGLLLNKTSVVTAETVIKSWDWVSVENEQNYTSNLMSRLQEPGGKPCKDLRAVNIHFINFNESRDGNFSTGDVHEVLFQALDDSGNSLCAGGDYYEVFLAGETWRSRPLTKDLGNGTYSFALQVHPDFAGAYTLTIILLFQHYEGLKYPKEYNKQIRSIPLTFTKSEAKLPELSFCKKSDFNRDVWSGRWTQHGRNGSCDISDDGRFRCLDPDYLCPSPWCNGSLGMLESNGWVYSAHCSFRLLPVGDVWNCLNNRWLFFWGDSTTVDNVQNILFFFLGLPSKEVLSIVQRHFDHNFTNPNDNTQSVRITQLFNGHHDVNLNEEGLLSLSNEGYREMLKKYFNESSVPDTVVFNSGLHDVWHDMPAFISSAEYAASFWKNMTQEVKNRGLEVSNFIFRSSVTTAAKGRTLQYNPNKLEAFNGILLEKLKAVGLVTAVVDDFDMTWAWHFDNRCNDGKHYGRFPGKWKWFDGQIGHQYFVDLMLGQVILNAICPM